VFPDALRRRIGRDAAGRSVIPGIGRPVSVDLEAGDAFVFRGNHLHASQLNRTDETRVVVSYRAVLGVPTYATAPGFRFRYSGASGFWASALAFAADLQWHVFRRILGGGPVGAPFIAPPPVEALDTAALAPGRIRPMDERTCAVRLEDQRIVAFERFCPHEGGDLASATLSAGQIVCPGHGTPFDAATGRSGCPGVRDLSVWVVTP
jgi:nitrite reductase/ring-hydroxylating ferredoxin subunit